MSAIATNTVTLSSPPSSSSSVTTAYAAAPVKHAGFSSLDEAVKGARSAVRTLLALHDTLLAQPAQVNRLVSAPWVRNTSAFVRTLGTEVPLLMQVCLAMYSSRSSSGTPAGVSAECSAAEVDALLQGITSPPLTPAAVLGQLSELISAVFLNILGGFLCCIYIF